MELSEDADGSARPVRYRSPLRAQRAADTKERVAVAARELFAANGFSGTTISAIAALAGVSVQTVYATFGSKGAIVRALLNQFETDADAAGWLARIEQASDPVDMLRLFAQWTTVLFVSSRTSFAATQGAAADPAVIELRDEGDRHRRAALQRLIGRVAGSDGLRVDVPEERAVDRAWMLTGIELYLAAVTGCGWSDDDYRDWLTETLHEQLLRPELVEQAGRMPRPRRGVRGS